LRSRLASLEATIATDEAQLESDKQRLSAVTEEIARLVSDEESRKEEAGKLGDRIDEHQRSIEEFEENLAGMERKHHQANRTAADMRHYRAGPQKHRAEKRPRLEVLAQLVADGEGFEQGTQAVSRGDGDIGPHRGKIRKPLASYLQVVQRYAEARE